MKKDEWKNEWVRPLVDDESYILFVGKWGMSYKEVDKQNKILPLLSFDID